MIGRLKGNGRDEYAPVPVDPPLVGQSLGPGAEDLHTVVLATRHQGRSLIPITRVTLGFDSAVYRDFCSFYAVTKANGMSIDNESRVPATILKPCNCAGLHFSEAALRIARTGRNPTGYQRTGRHQATRTEPETIGHFCPSLSGFRILFGFAMVATRPTR